VGRIIRKYQAPLMKLVDHAEHRCPKGYLHTIQCRLNSRQFLNIGRNNIRRTVFSQYREIGFYE